MRNIQRFSLFFFSGLLVLLTIASLAAAPLNTGKVKQKKPGGVKILPALGKNTLTVQEIARILPLSTATNTKLQVLRDQGPEFKLWRDRVDLDWRAADKDKDLTFRWNTKDNKVASAVWQVTIHRYSSTNNNWETPSGMVASGKLSKVPGAGSNSEFSVDFSQFAPKPNALKQILPIFHNKSKLFVNTHTNTGSSKTELKKKNDLIARINLQNGQAVKKSKQHPPTTMHVVYYVRVIPLNSSGKKAGIPSAPVEIAYGDPAPQPYVDMSYLVQSGYSDPSVPANAPELKHPDVQINSYVPIQKDKPGKIYHYVVSSTCPSFFGMLKPGTRLDYTPHKDEKSWWEHVGDFFSDAFSFAVDAVNWVATAYNDIKEFAVSWAPDSLQGILSAGLDIGLAAIGIPPSIPNFDELSSMGTDYLIKAAADYAGVDQEIASMAVGEFMKAASSQSNCGGNPSIWLKPDPDYYYRPAYMIIRISNNTNQATDQVTLNVAAEPVGDKDAQEHGETVFYTASAFVPTLQPGENVSVPVFLEECMPLRWDDTGLQDGLHRFWCRYNACPVKFSISTYNGGKYKNRWKMQQTLQLEHAYYGYAGN